MISFYKGLHLFCTRSVRMRNGFGEIDNGLASLLVFVKYQSRRCSSGTNSNLQDLMEKCSDNMKQLKSKHLKSPILTHLLFFFLFSGESIAPIDALQLQSEVEQAEEQIRLRLASKKLEESSSIWSSSQKLQVVGEEADLKVRKVSSTPFTPYFSRSMSK